MTATSNKANSSTWGAPVRKFAETFAIVLVTLLFFDIGMWFSPWRFEIFRQYKLGPRPPSAADSMYRRYYHSNSEQRGFDITPDFPRSEHLIEFENFSYPIWANRLGCFDRNADVPSEPYIYVAGDSHTWGFAKYENKWATILERRVRIPVLKCGVTHSGQFHQLSKMKEIVNSNKPKTIIVGFFENDLANDYFFPHSHIVDGYIVDDVGIVDGAVKRKSVAELQSAFEEKVRANTIQPSPKPIDLIKEVIRRHSLTYNVFSELWQPRNAQQGSRAIATVYSSFDYINRPQIVKAEQQVVLSYLDNEYAGPNRVAIKEFRDYSSGIGAKLIFMLIPPKRHHTNTSYYGQVREYLQGLGIQYLDLSYAFERGESGRYYWEVDGHLNELGNEFAGNKIYEFITALDGSGAVDAALSPARGK